ncbi:MAG TPA: LD-carboxypeptidase [Dongiaceae bacterium]|nr:LD-carboxypeptidase [Dongiaceae bacterium]
MTVLAAVQKPRALRRGARFMPFAPASPSPAEPLQVGRRELERLGYAVSDQPPLSPEAYFAGPAEARRKEFLSALRDESADALVATRGGYGSVYLLDGEMPRELPPPKPVTGFSDITTLQIYLWEKHRWITFYGPMLGAGLNYGAGEPRGYDKFSFESALTDTHGGWSLELQGESLNDGSAEGVLLGGAMTLLESTLGTPWELNTAGAILLLEDRGMKPYQVDRVLMHLKLSGKLAQVRGIVLGDFPDCPAPVPGSPSVRDVCRRILAPLGLPIVYGAPVGHTERPMLTVPLGVRARLEARGTGKLTILEAAVME